MKSCVKLLEVKQLRERSAHMPILFGSLFEGHSAAVPSAAQWGEDSRLLPLGAACFHTGDCRPHLYPAGFFWVTYNTKGKQTQN